MAILRPIPPRLSRLFSVVIVLAWAAQMAVLAQRSLGAGSTGSFLAADLARYGSSAQWKGVYYRGEKIGFTVSQTLPTDGGYEIQEEGQLRMGLLDTTTAVHLRTTAQVDAQFNLKSFEFVLDPGTGPMTIAGALDGTRLDLTVETAAGRRSESRLLPEPPLLSLNLSRHLAASGLQAGKKLEVLVFDPATLRNAPMTVEVQAREVVQVARRPMPAFRVETRFSGITSRSWITDVGEVVREESPTGFIVVRETRGTATALAVPGAIQNDLLSAVAVKPVMQGRIDDPLGVATLRMRLEGAPLDRTEIEGGGQSWEGDVLVLRNSEDVPPSRLDTKALEFTRPEPFIESDAPEIREEALKAVQGATEPAVRAERLTRHVNALLEKKPLVGLPSAREVLRTKVGDCNEHTALYVAMARSLGLPARVAVGLVFLHGAFYYHAWPEVYVEGPPGQGRWLTTDPTLNQYPADATHLRLTRGGLDRQTAILPLIGHLKITVLEVTTLKNFEAPVLVGRPAADVRPIEIPVPRRTGSRSCWSRPL